MRARQANNLKLWRDQMGLTVEQLAELLGISGASVSRIENGTQQPRPELLSAIADLFHVNQASFYGNPDSVEPAMIGRRRVPVLDHVQAGEWTGVVTEALAEGRDFLLTERDYRDGVFAMRVRGLSMMPVFEEGDVVLVDPSLHPRPNDYAIFRNDITGEAALKCYKERSVDEQGRTVFEAFALNDGYPSWTSDKQPISVVGTVVEFRKYRQR